MQPPALTTGAPHSLTRSTRKHLLHLPSHVLQCPQQRQVLHGARHRNSALRTEDVPKQADISQTHTTHHTPHTTLMSLPTYKTPQGSHPDYHTHQPHAYTQSHTSHHHACTHPAGHTHAACHSVPSPNHWCSSRTLPTRHIHHCIHPHTYPNIVSDVKCCTAPAIDAPPSAPRRLSVKLTQNKHTQHTCSTTVREHPHTMTTYVSHTTPNLDGEPGEARPPHLPAHTQRYHACTRVSPSSHSQHASPPNSRTPDQTHTHHCTHPLTYSSIVSDVKCCTAPAIAAPPTAPRSLKLKLIHTEHTLCTHHQIAVRNANTTT